MKILAYTKYLNTNRILGILTCATVLMCVAYMYLLSSSVMHVVIRSEVEQKIQAAHTAISSKENAYIAAQHTITEKIALHEGYVETADKDFINRSKPQLVLSTDVTP